MVTYRQKIGDRSPARAGFNTEGGKITDTYYVTPDEVNEAILDILGDVEPMGDGRLKRALPKHYPEYPWLFASSIETIQGVGRGSFEGGEEAQLDAEDGFESDPITDQFWQYPLYEITVAFAPLPVAVLADDTVEMVTITAYDDDGAPIVVSYPDGEQNRFVDGPHVDPNPEIISAQKGAMQFITGTGPIYAPTAGAPHGYSYSAFPSIVLGKARIMYNWLRVPYSYLTSPNSYLVSLIGRVNQIAFDRYGPGELLYLGSKAKPHVPCVPSRELATGSTSFTTEKICDVTLMFDLTMRPAAATVTLPNKSQICAGHNLQPWFGDHKFYPAITAVGEKTGLNDSTKWRTTHQSAIIQLLFKDPDV